MVTAPKTSLPPPPRDREEESEGSARTRKTRADPGASRGGSQKFVRRKESNGTGRDGRQLAQDVIVPGTPVVDLQNELVGTVVAVTLYWVPDEANKKQRFVRRIRVD